METTIRTNLDEVTILTAVRSMYRDVAQRPNDEFHFLTGREACRWVGYPEDELDALPDAVVESFAGVGYPFQGKGIRPGDTVVDIGSGSGVDVFIAAQRTGPDGRVIGIDMTPEMIRKARANIDQADVGNAEIVEAMADSLPLDDGTVDVVTSNGVINLIPDKEGAFREIFRVLKPGGRLQIADIVLMKPVSAKSKANPQLWAECIVGAERDEDYLESIRLAGFQNVQTVDQLNYFDGCPESSTRRSAQGFGAHTLVITARKP